MPKTIVSLGQCHVRAKSKQAVYEQMEQFLDESPHTRAVSRTVRRTTKRERQETCADFTWCGVLRWERTLRVEHHKAA